MNIIPEYQVWNIPVKCIETVNWKEIVKSDFVFWNFKMLKQSRVMNDGKMFAKILENISDFIFHPLDVDTTKMSSYTLSTQHIVDVIISKVSDIQFPSRRTAAP